MELTWEYGRIQGWLRYMQEKSPTAVHPAVEITYSSMHPQGSIEHLDILGIAEGFENTAVHRKEFCSHGA